MIEEIAQRFNTCQTLLKVLQENLNALGYLMMQSKENEKEDIEAKPE